MFVEFKSKYYLKNNLNQCSAIGFPVAVLGPHNYSIRSVTKI